MTGVKVVDASAIAALLFGEPEAEGAAARLDGSRLIAPGLLEFELANICVIKRRRHPGQRDEILAGYRLRGALGIELHATDPDEVVALAERFGLTAYDASYLWLAQSLGADLVTLDAALLRAMQAR